MIHGTVMERHFRLIKTIVDDLVERDRCPRPRVGVLCENSCVTANFWKMCGFDVLTCDLVYESADTTGEIPHYRGDALHLLDSADLDIVIAFPPCTYLSNAQTGRLVHDPSRWEQMERGVRFMQAIYYSDVEMVRRNREPGHAHRPHLRYRPR